MAPNGQKAPRDSFADSLGIPCLGDSKRVAIGGKFLPEICPPIFLGNPQSLKRSQKQSQPSRVPGLPRRSGVGGGGACFAIQGASERNPNPPNPKILENYKKITQNGQRFREGVGGRGLATDRALNAAKIAPRIVSTFSQGRNRENDAEKMPESLVKQGFPRANPLCPPTPFQNL